MDERVTAQAAQRSNALPVKSTADIAIDGMIAAGIDTFIYAGCDALAILQSSH